MPRLRPITFLTSLLFLLLLPTAHAQKPPLTLDEFFNAVYFESVQISPDGHAVVVETLRADWSANRFRNDLWLYRDDSGGSLVQLTQSGHDSSPQWSPDGRWIAFLSDREKDVTRVYVISASGGEAFPVTAGDEGVHVFTWSADSRQLYFATRTPWTKAQKDVYAEEWQDVVRFREGERGDTIFRVDLTSLIAKKQTQPSQGARTPVSEKLTTLPYRVRQMIESPNGRLLAVATDSPFLRYESHDPYGIYVGDLSAGTFHLAIHTQLGVHEIHWATDSRHVFFTYKAGTPEGPFQPGQMRLYSVDAAGGRAVRWASRFTGEVGGPWTRRGAFAVAWDGPVFASGRVGTEMQPYVQSNPHAEFLKQPAWPGMYEKLSAARHSLRAAFVYSSLQRPEEVYVADAPDRLQQAKPITAFNHLFTERELPQGKPYRWVADDGTSVEGMLIYPPGRFQAKHLPMFTFIHGGPEEVFGNDFQPSWYRWAALAATEGWLVFEPNYRGSTGYGDAFTAGLVPHAVSRPGKDILDGVDALVKDGIADADQLTVGGYSYGGVLTNWLITQTARFKAAVTGAGAVEWAGVWSGLGIYIAYSLGGVPWEAEGNYNAEAAIWQMGKVATPTHIVIGSGGVFEDRLLESALQARGVPHSLLIFPGEDHDLDANPWHGKIKVREELKWLEKYGRKK